MSCCDPIMSNHLCALPIDCYLAHFAFFLRINPMGALILFLLPNILVSLTSATSLSSQRYPIYRYERLLIDTFVFTFYDLGMFFDQILPFSYFSCWFFGHWELLLNCRKARGHQIQIEAQRGKVHNKERKQRAGC